MWKRSAYPTTKVQAHGRILEEAWQRYGMPVALTEVHAGCTREDQLRWFARRGEAASAARSRGVDVRAVTMWSLLGAFDWNSLVVRDDNVYEVGAFDVRSAPPRRTALGDARTRARDGHDRRIRSRASPDGGSGARRADPSRAAVAAMLQSGPPPIAPILIAGGTGTLGSALTRACEVRGLRAVRSAAMQLDITSPDAILRALARWRPWAIINAAGYVRVDDAEATPRLVLARQHRRRATAGSSEPRHVRHDYVTVSTDLVFDGLESGPMSRVTRHGRLNTYGASKRAAEERIAGARPARP